MTRLHYLNIVDPREGLITGMTRDGTFRIEGGKVTRAARQPALHDVVSGARRLASSASATPRAS